MNNSKWLKRIISFSLGVICFITATFPYTIDAAYDLYLIPGLLLPALVALCFGTKYALICCTLGLAMFYPFLTVPTNGWANLVTATFILIWAVGHGLCSNLIKKKSIPFFSIYIFQFLFVIVFLLINKLLIKFAVRFNSVNWYGGYTFSFLPDNLINTSTIILIETLTICILAANSILSISFIKRALGMKSSGYERGNSIVFAITLIFAVLFAAFSTKGTTNEMMSISFTINAYQSSIGNMQLMLLKIATVLFLGDFLMHYLEYYNEQEQKNREMAETQKAVFESSDDMIWCMDGLNGNIITSNSVAKAFFDMKSKDSVCQNFYSLLSDDESVQWMDFIDEAVKTGHSVVEYFDSFYKKYYEIQLRRIDLGTKIYDIAVFAKDITDEILNEDYIKLMNDELELRVLERTQEMQKAYNEMENLCYVIAHEFKSPVRAISLYNDIVMEESDGTASQETFNATKKIEQYCNKTLDMISEILEYSKMKSSRLNLVRVNMNKLVEEVISELKMMNSYRDIRIDYEKLPKIMGDEILLRCCIYNILSNSVKYSASRDYTHIQVTYEEKKEEYVFCFRDNGVGFDMEYAQNLFQMFTRLHKDTEFDGSGIGLVTVKNIIEKHGGKVSLESKLDDGCAVYFSLPK